MSIQLSGLHIEENWVILTCFTSHSCIELIPSPNPNFLNSSSAWNGIPYSTDQTAGVTSSSSKREQAFLRPCNTVASIDAYCDGLASGIP